MDPQKTWDQLLCAFAEDDWDCIEEIANELLHWMDRGGTPPQVCDRKPGADFQEALARAGCIFALEALECAWSTTDEPA